MKIQIYSDLHLDFHPNKGIDFINSLPNKNSDVVIIAGDLCDSRIIKIVLKTLSNHFSKQEIIYCAGNHDFYNAKRNGKDGFLFLVKEFIKNTTPNIHLLENESITINKQTFHVSTLWFAHSGLREDNDFYMNDFSVIHDIYDWIGSAEENAINYFQNNVKSDDIVITHHLPHYNSVHDKYKNHLLNKYFLSENYDLVLKNQQPKLHIHGHSHSSMDYKIYNTMVRSNPYGYWNEELNPDYIKELIIDV